MLFEEVDFPLYTMEKKVCDLSMYYCESSFPIITRYYKGKIYEYKEKIAVVNKELNYFSFNNKVPLERILVSSNWVKMDGYANLIIEEKIAEFNVFYNGGYIFPLLPKLKNGLVSFEFENKYYVDLLEGKVSEEYQYDGYYTNQIIFPYKDAYYDVRVELINEKSCFEKIVLNFRINTRGNLLGCSDTSKYCLRRSY